MITSADFDRAVYRKPRLEDDRPVMENIFGLDSEAYITGTPFMLCTCVGDVFDPKDVPGCFFDNPKYEDANFMLWNMKYDSGAILYHLPREVLHELWDKGAAEHEGTSYSYIPHKQLRLKRGNAYLKFWDVAQFYKSSLDNAAKTYLGEGKLEIATKRFSRKYVARFRKAIARYCVQDALLTRRLGEYFIKRLSDFEITASSIYSCASISFKYFCTHTKIVTPYRYWYSQKKLLALACDAYQGGKFEITARGSFTGYEYDITSAYPYEIRNLVDIDCADSDYTPKYFPDAMYSFFRVLIRNTPDNVNSHLPFGLMEGNMRYYPRGTYYVTITKAEYEYALEVGVEPEIIDAVHLFVNRKRYPYRKCIDTVFKIKSDAKGKDRMLYNTSKIIANSFYGKTAQCIEQHDGKVIIGAGWNPIYASVITANTRIKVTRLQNLLGPHCLAVHTDSVISDTALPGHLVKNRLGEFEFVVSGPATLIACGIYQIGDVCAWRGFIPKAGDSWRGLLSKKSNINRTEIPYKQLHVESWLEAMAKGHEKQRVNVFAQTKKIVDLNCDTKRIWPKPVTSRELLYSLQSSFPRPISESEPPKLWSNQHGRNKS